MKIITWLLLFIIGSLIVTYIVSPNSFKSIGASINNIIKPTIANVAQTNYVVLIPSQMQEYSFYSSMYDLKSCASIDAFGQSEGVSDLRMNVCQEACGNKNMNYGYYSCNKDLLTCYCKP